MDFSFGFGLGNSAYLLSGYNPLINYNWSTTTTSGLRYLKDVGSTPKYDASMYFGRGAYLNGVDQTITVPINTTIQTALKRVNGIVTINETSQILTNYVISGLGVHKDYYLFTRLLTTAEKDSYINTPEAFYAMAQADATCVLNMPMCENDGYVRNMKTYSEGDNFSRVTIGSQTMGTGNSITQNNNTFNITNVVLTGQVYYPLVRFTPDVFNSDLYYQEIEVKCVTGTLKVGVIEGLPGTSINEVLTTGQSRVYTKVSGFANLGGQKGAIYLDGLNYPSFTAEITLKNVRKITNGIQPIQNYTTACRTNAQNLSYGLQTCKFNRDSLGVIQSASDYLECDGVGYANTGWTPDLTKKLSIEFIVKNNDTLIGNILIGCIDDPTNRLALGFRGTNARILLGNAYPQYAISSTIYYGTLTMTGIAGQSIIYINGVYKGLVGESTLGNPLSMFWLGGTPLGIYKKIDTRLFKVHNKVLTQEEVTKNYNSYVAKGLLS